jgi:hypothetical protein
MLKTAEERIKKNPNHVMMIQKGNKKRKRCTPPNPKGKGKEKSSSSECRMDLPGPTASVGTRTDYSVGPWDYLACATRHLMAWDARTTVEKYSDRKLYMSCTM